MEIKKHIITWTFTVVVMLTIMTGTLFYAYQYTGSHSTSTNSLQNRPDGKTQGEFGQNANTNGGPSNGGGQSGDSSKSEN